MKRFFLSRRHSIRTVLVAVLLVLGGWGVFASLLRIDDSLGRYRESRDHAALAGAAVRLLTASQHLAYERGRTAVVLRRSAPISPADRLFLEERRRLAETALTEALQHLQHRPGFDAGALLDQWQALRELRQQVDQEAAFPGNSQRAVLADRWFDTASELIRRIQGMTEELVGDFRPGGMTIRLMLLASAALELRNIAGIEASLIAQALSAGEAPPPERLHYLHELRGREDRLWQEVARFAGYIGISELEDRVHEVQRHHFSVFRPLQDEALAALAAGQPALVPLNELTSASLPTLDGIAGLMTQSAQEGLRIATRDMLKARKLLAEQIIWLLSILILLAISLHYVVHQVVRPLEQVDGELRRLGALPPEERRGNEIDRLNASSAALEKSIAARAEARVRLRTLNDELNEANRRLSAGNLELQKAKDELERRVAERTAELQSANQRLQRELVERKQAQEALRRSAEEIRDLYDQAPCGYHSLDRDGRFTRVNDTELKWLGYAREEVLGKKFTDLLTVGSLQTFRDSFPLFMEMGWIRDLEYEMVRKDGTVLPVLLSATAVYDEDGGYLMSRSTIYDITERKQIEQLKDEMISAVSHEMRTPLTSILGYTEFILHHELSAAQIREYLQVVEQEAEKLDELIGNFLDFQRQRIGNPRRGFGLVNVCALLPEIAARFGVQSPAHRVVVDCPLDLEPVRGNEKLLRRMLELLVSNAVKFSPEGGEVRLSAAVQSGRVKIGVSDQGIGIPEKYLEHIFEPLFRVDNTDRRMFGGTGLGLALVKEIALGHGGRVWAESSLGLGSTFYVEIPTGADRTAADQESPSFP